jgi:soluble lytic murein transglycosylase-like protein
MLQTRLPSISRPLALVAGLLLALPFWSAISAGSTLLPDTFWRAPVPPPVSRVRAAPELTALPLAGVPDPVRIVAATQRRVHRLPYGPVIDEVARAAGLDPLLLASIVEAESSFDAAAVSTKGAQGLMQLMPDHFEAGQEGLDPEANLALGARLFASLLARYGGDLELALAAYHAGPGAVDRFGAVPPFRSTRAYVRRVLELYLEHQTAVAESVSFASAAGGGRGAAVQRGF